MSQGRELSGTSVWRPQSRYTVSRRECRIKFPQNQRCRAKIALHPPQIKVSHLSPDPPCRTFLSFTAGRGRGGLVEGIKNLLMPLFLMGCFPVDFQDVKRPLRTKSMKRPIKVGKRPINKGKRPIKAKVLVGVSVGSLMGCFRAPPTWRKTAPLKRPIKRSMMGIAALLGSENGSRYRGVSQLQSHQSRYSVQLR